jgi:hypothetical protein
MSLNQVERKKKKYTIKVPVYTTELVSSPIDLFGGIAYKDMTAYVVRKINEFTTLKFPVVSDNRNKTLKTEIDSIETFENYIGDVPIVLLKIKAFTTNLYDGYFETGEQKIPFEKENRLGSENNYVLLYPVVDGITNKSYHFLVLVYEDPHKRSDELLKSSKLVLKEILKTPIRNLKLDIVLEELERHPVIPELQVRYTAIKYDDNLVDNKYVEYSYGKGVFKKQRDDKFKNMPFGKVQDLLNDPLRDDYQKKEARITVDGKEFKITKEIIEEAANEFKDTVEKVFNSRFEIEEEQLVSIYDPAFILENLTPIISNYRE